jgi:hypothetical protein
MANRQAGAIQIQDIPLGRMIQVRLQLPDELFGNTVFQTLYQVRIESLRIRVEKVFDVSTACSVP